MNIDESLKILKDDDIRLELCLGIPNSLQYYYLIYDNNDNKIGGCGIRLNNSEDNKYLGNIEYEIYPEYRGNNYALKASKLLGQVALYHNASKITITADPSNIASNKIIKNLGARFIELRSVPKKMRLYKTSKQVNAYELNLERGIL